MGIISTSSVGSSNVVEPASKGDLVTFSNKVVNLPIGTENEVLHVKLSEPTGLFWRKTPADQFLTTVGALLTFTQTGFVNAKGLGLNGQILTARPADTFGMEWENPPASKPTTYSNSIFIIFDSQEASPIVNNPMITTPDSSILLDSGTEFDSFIAWSPPSNGNATNWRWIIDANDFGSDTFKLEVRELPSTDTVLIASLTGTGIKTSAVTVALDSTKSYVYRITHTGSNTGKIDNVMMTFDFFPT